MSGITWTARTRFTAFAEYNAGDTTMGSWAITRAISQVSDGTIVWGNGPTCNHGGASGATGWFYSKVMRIKGFLGGLPNRGRITGLELRAGRSDGTTSSTYQDWDHDIRLLINDTRVGDNKAVPTMTPHVGTTISYIYSGGSGDIWGATKEQLNLSELYQDPTKLGLDYQMKHYDGSGAGTSNLDCQELDFRLEVDESAMLPAL